MFYSAFLIGLLGSFHCFGMCGPIALAIPVPREKRVIGSILYNLGRSLTYVLLGVIFGGIGMSFEILGFNKYLSIGVGVLMLLAIAIPQINKVLQNRYYDSSWMRWIKKKIGYFFKQRTFSATFSVGVLNGLIPCGLIYAAVAGSLVTSNVLDGAIFMFMFSLGTMPAMFSVFAIPMFKKLSRFGFNKLIPVLMTFLALIFIYRGITFDIPQIDPFLDATGFGKITICK